MWAVRSIPSDIIETDRSYHYRRISIYSQQEIQNMFCSVKEQGNPTRTAQSTDLTVRY